MHTADPQSFDLSWWVEVDDIVAASRLAVGSYVLQTLTGIACLVLAAAGVVLWLLGPVSLRLQIGTVVFLALGIFTLVAAQTPLFDRRRVLRNMPTILGMPATTRVDAYGMTNDIPIHHERIEWFNTIKVRQNDRVVLFMMDRRPLACIPMTAFRTEAECREFLAFVQRQIEASRSLPAISPR